MTTCRRGAETPNGFSQPNRESEITKIWAKKFKNPAMLVRHLGDSCDSEERLESDKAFEI